MPETEPDLVAIGDDSPDVHGRSWISRPPSRGLAQRIRQFFKQLFAD